MKYRPFKELLNKIQTDFQPVIATWAEQNVSLVECDDEELRRIVHQIATCVDEATLSNYLISKRDRKEE